VPSIRSLSKLKRTKLFASKNVAERIGVVLCILVEQTTIVVMPVNDAVSP
jgi:hypothetical protein